MQERSTELTVASVVSLDESAALPDSPPSLSKDAPPVAVLVEVNGPVVHEKMTPRHWALFVEIVVLCLSVMYVEFLKEANWIPWILSSYNIIGAVWTSISGCLSDLYGPKWITVINLCIYMVGQVIAALSKRSIFMLIAARALQGFGMAVFVLAMTIVRKEFPAKAVNGLMAVISAVMSIGMSVGIVGGAAELDRMEWNKMFWVTFPIIAVFVIAFTITMPGGLPFISTRFCNKESNGNVASEEAQSKPSLRHIDVIGAALLAVGVVVLLMGLTFSETWGWRKPGTICMVIIGPILLVALVVWEVFCKAPLIPVRSLFRRDQLTLCVVSTFSGIVQFSLFQLLPYLYRSPIMNFKETKMMPIGVMLLPFGIATLIATPIALVMGRYTGYSLAVVSANAVGTLGVGLMIPFHDTKAQTVLLNCVAGGGLGMSTIAVMNMVSGITPKVQFGAVSGANMLLRFVGGSLGPVFVTLILRKHQAESDTGMQYTNTAYVQSFAFMTGVFGFVTACSLVLPKLFAVCTSSGRKELSERGWGISSGH
eukprot:m51a1_g1566 hypothetical protein (539) ;mRNA; r:60402-62310